MKSEAYLFAPGSCLIPKIGHIFVVYLYFMSVMVTYRHTALMSPDKALRSAWSVVV